MSSTSVRFQRPILLPGHTAAVYALCPWKEGFLSGDGAGQIVHWQLAQSDQGQVLAEIPDRVFCMQPVGDNQLAVGTLSGDLFWLDLNKKTELPKRWRYHEDGLFGLCLHHNRLFAVGGGGKLSCWNTVTGELAKSSQLDTVRLRSITWLAKAQCLAIGTATGDVLLVDHSSLRILHRIVQAHALTIFSIADIGSYFITAGRDGQLRTWSSTAPFPQKGHVAAHASTINALAFRQNQQTASESSVLLASAGRDRETRIWTWELPEINGELVLAKALTASRDGSHAASVNCCLWLDTMLITGGDDRTVRCFPLI